jgi:hypothetical protein
LPRGTTIADAKDMLRVLAIVLVLASTAHADAQLALL